MEVPLLKSIGSVACSDPLTMVALKSSRSQHFNELQLDSLVAIVSPFKVKTILGLMNYAARV